MASPSSINALLNPAPRRRRRRRRRPPPPPVESIRARGGGEAIQNEARAAQAAASSRRRGQAAVVPGFDQPVVGINRPGTGEGIDLEAALSRILQPTPLSTAPGGLEDAKVDAQILLRSVQPEKITSRVTDEIVAKLVDAGLIRDDRDSLIVGTKSGRSQRGVAPPLRDRQGRIQFIRDLDRFRRQQRRFTLPETFR